ncbi:hypothetical protein PF004_g22479 [Phytophthora fragariae]|uniref:Armadillo repeat-containing domain-containing protein n=1 Tax=Phytophthora fragariae TaxID=53985 RepID=A0A6G0N0R8_9STRA|nr:hypothetical protein PF004_g22479 [Phytophthora fragariae]
MTTRREGTEDTFNELVALLRRNEDGEKHAADVEVDMRRLLMMARDAYLRDQLVQVQGVRRITQITKAATHTVTQRICAGILGNLARSERGRLSASSCDRWNCVSHWHQCPLSMLLWNTHASGDNELMRVSAAALLAFSTQNQCQRHLDTLAGIPVLLSLLNAKQADGAATDVAIYAAATLWNICKAPALLLKLETIYGILRDQLTRKLSNLLVAPLEPFQLYLTPTGERGMPVLLEFDGENLNVLITASISTQLSVVLSIENYTAESGKLDTHFFCDVCVVKTPLCYWDFLAAHAQHEQLLTENMFKSVGITRVPSTPAMVPPVSKRSMSRSAETEAHLHQHQEESTANKSVADFDEEDRSPWPSVMLFDRNAKLVGVGDKCFQIPASSRDPEVYILKVRYVSTRAYAATRQERAIPKKENGDNNTEAPISNNWEVSFAHQSALDIPLVPGNAIFWPARFTRDILALEYTRRTVDELEHAFLYEFQGEQPHDKTFSIGCGLLDTANPFSSAASPLSSAQGLWMNLTPRKGICMKLLAAQLGNLKKIQDVHILHTKKGKSGVRKLRKPHYPGQQLNKIAVDTT